MDEDNQKFFEEINPLLKSIYEDACQKDTSHRLSFLADTEGRYCENDLCGEGGMKKVFAAVAATAATANSVLAIHRLNRAVDGSIPCK